MNETEELLNRIRALPQLKTGGIDPELVVAMLAETTRDKTTRSTVNINWPSEVREAVDMFCHWSGKSKTDFINEAVYFVLQVYIVLVETGNPIDAEAVCRVAATMRLTAMNAGKEHALAKLRGVDHVMAPAGPKGPQWGKLTSPGLSAQVQ